MQIYMSMLVCSDNSKPDISLFFDKQDCLDFINAQIDEYCKAYHFFRTPFNLSLNQWRDSDGEKEFVFYLKEMEVIKCMY